MNLPASPQAWAMNRYGNETVNLYTGTVGANIPIYTYSDNDFTLPVSINYSSDGYRPNIQSGPLGLGWNLSLGGAITREVRGIPDDTPANGDCYRFQDKFAGYSMNESAYGSSPDVYGYAYYNQAYDPDTYVYNDDLVRSGKLGEEYMFVKAEWRRVAGGPNICTHKCYETMPDIFHFSAPGINGRFVLQPGGSAIFYDTEGSPYGYEVSFGLDGAGFTGFVVTTPDRYMYTYSQIDCCHSFCGLGGSSDDNLTTPGSWRLTRIEAPDGRYVNFIYGVENYSQSSQHVRSLDWANLVPRDAAPDESGSDTASSSGGDGVSRSDTRSDCLTEVRVCNADGTAVCTMNMEYVDGVLEYGADNLACRKLSSVTVKNIGGRVIRHCMLSYDVVHDPVMRSNGVTLLKSVSVDGEGTTTFSYYGNDGNSIGSSTRFPDMGTLCVDWYGYYNPSVTSQTFAPSMQSAMSAASDTWLLSMRQPDLGGTRLGMLRSITYPTGGTANYEYELNTFSMDLTGLDGSSCGVTSGLRVRNIVLRDSDGNQMQRRSFLYGSGLRSSGTLLRRPTIYTWYRLESSGYSCIEHRSLSTTSDLFYGVSPHVEYTQATERITRDGSPDICEIDYSYSTSADGLLGNSYGEASREFDSMAPVFFCRHLDDGQRNESLFHAVRQVQECPGGGKMLSREERVIAGGTSRLVRSEGYTYTPCHNESPMDYTARTFCLSLSTDYTYRFNSPRLTERSTTEYALDGTILKTVTNVLRYDSLQRPMSMETTDSEGNTLSTRYTWDSVHPWLLLEKSSYRGELMMSGVQYSWQRPSASSHPDWFVPQEMKRASITLDHFEDEGYEPWDETSSTWHRVATFSGFNAVGNPTVVRDAMNHETRYTWDASGLNLTSMTQYPVGSTNPGLTTRWTWIPLVGATSITRPSGKVERYAYDQYGRLESASNTANETLAQYGYHITAAQDDHSWTRMRTYRTAGQSAEDVTFYNGLGYPEQSNSVDAGNGYDIITPYSYDALLRPEREWLPVPCEGTESEYFRGVGDWGLEWYQELYGTVPDGDDEPVSVRPYSRTISEFSPSGRPLTSMLPGEDYDQHPTTFEYLADTIDCRAVTGVKTTDGDGRIAIEWKDYEDRTVAQDRFLGDTLARTLYRYDWRGNLTDVVTPEGNTYNYTYDGFSRVISKKIPGKEIESYSYDILDRLVRSTDGNQRSHEICIEYTYDDLGRETGRYAHLENEETDESRPMATYTYSPTTGLKTSERIYQLTADGYVDDSYITRNFTYDNEERVTRVVETLDGEYVLTTVFTYDLAGNVLTSTETCEKGNGDRTVILTTRTYDSRSRLTGETVSVDGVQKSVTAVLYDELGRPRLKTYGSGSGAISESTTYTIQGWTSTKWNNLMHMDYSYEGSAPNYRSWTGNITKWNWTHMAANGEIDANGNPASYQRHSESFVYDGLNRLKGSEMTIGSGESAVSSNRWSERNIRYDLEGNLLHLDRYQSAAATPETSLNFTYTGSKRNGYRYDSNGNISFDPLRSFEIKYNLLNLASEVWAPNLIPSVPVDGPGEEIIDDGGLIIGGLRPLSDEPAIEFPQRAMTLVSEIVYYADGTRAGVMNPEDGYWTSRYIGSLIYEGEPGEESLSGIQTADGFIQWRGSAANSQMQYFLRDHLGSVRVIASDRNTVISRSDYLPFGVRMTGNGLTGESSTTRSSYFGFSGKENEMWDGLDAMSGNTPHWLKGERYQHFGARAYDPVTCIFMQIDPMAEKYYGLTPYHYCAGNPVMLVDPDGELGILARAAIGAMVGSAIEGITALANGASNQELLGALAKGAIEGAAIGALGPQAGKVASALVSATSSAAASVVDQSISNGNFSDTDWKQVAVESIVGVAFSRISNSTKSMVTSAMEKTISSSEYKAGVKASVKENFSRKGVKVTSSKLTEVAENKVKTIEADAADAINVTKDALDLTVGINASGYTSKIVNEKIDK